MNYVIFPLGDAGLTVEFGNEISAELNNLRDKSRRFFRQNPFPGFIETVPAYASLSVFYNVSIVRKNFPEFPTAFEAIKNFTETALQNLRDLQAKQAASSRNSRLLQRGIRARFRFGRRA
jgi:inhibitor of KinA